jgi:hypothetical protein
MPCACYNAADYIISTDSPNPNALTERTAVLEGRSFLNMSKV